MDPIANPEVDVTDPIVVGITLLFTWLLGKFAPPFQDKLRPWLPIMALALAVASRATMDAVQGEPVTLESFFRGLAAGAMAVTSHQIRQISKAKIENKQDE